MGIILRIALVALGSAIGGVTRWGVGLGLARLLGTGFPFGTFFINVTGCFFLGWFLTMLTRHLGPDHEGWVTAQHLHLLLGVGFAGGYTTFSTFGWESDRLFWEGDTFLGLVYVLGSVCLGLLAVRAGVMVAHWW